MTSFISEILFNGKANQYDRTKDAPCYATPAKRFRRMFDQTSSFSDRTGLTEPRIHPGPPPTLAGVYPERNEVTSSVPIDSLPISANPFTDLFSTRTNRNGRFSANDPRELIRWNVVNEKDAQRGFRMFDGILLSVKDVSSEELFLERMRIAYAAYDTHVAGLVNRSPLDVTKALVQALSACITKYFSTQSMLRTNRPFIAKVLHLDCPDMFCAHSDFVQSFLFTNASAEDEAIIALAENVYAENNFNVCADFNYRESSNTTNNGTWNEADGSTTETDALFDLGMRIAESSVVGGSHPSFSMRGGPATSTINDDYNAFTDSLPFAQRKETAYRADSNTAMLIIVTDFEALHNYVSYALYLTPTQLSRRYTVNFDSSRRPTSLNLDCSRNREAKNAQHRRDGAKAAIRAVIEKKRRDKIDTMGQRSEACDVVLKQRAVQTIERNNDVLCHVLLMLFDKCLSALIDRGFENLNARRGYAINSAKEIGAATIYTGIIDTVGEISTNLEGYTFENISTKDLSGHVTRFTFPPNTIVTGSTGMQNTGDRQVTVDYIGGDGYEQHARTET